MEVDLKRIHQVLMIVRAGSFSLAAEMLHITQPALSRSIATLEEQYGIRIFDRGRGGASLTAVGKAFVEDGEVLLGKARSVEHNFRLLGKGEAGRITFGIGPLIASMVLPALSLHFIRNRPNLHVKTIARSAGALYQELMDDNIEILFCGGEQLNNLTDTACEKVGEIDVSIIVKATHPLASRKTVSLDDLSDYPIISGAEMQIMVRESGMGSFICDNYHVLRETVLQSDSVWVSSPQFVIEDLRERRVASLKLANTALQPKVGIYMVSRKGDVLSPAAAAVRDFVREYFSNVDTEIFKK